MAAFSTIAALGITAAGVGASIAGGNSQKKAINRASDIQERQAQEANALTRDIYNQNASNLSPFMDRGNQAATGLQAFLGFAPAEQQITARNAFQAYLNNSNFSFANQEMERGLAAKLSAAGGIGSGAGQKALARYQQDLQSGYRNEYLGLLANQQGVGLSGANALAGVGTNYANTVNATNANLANNLGNGALAKAGATSGMWNGIAGSLGQGFGMAGGFGSSFFGRGSPNLPGYGG